MQILIYYFFFVAFVPSQVTQRECILRENQQSGFWLQIDEKLLTFDNPLFIRLCSVQCNIFAARIIITDIALQARSKVLYFWYDKCNYRCKIITL